MPNKQQSVLQKGLKMATPRSLYFFIFAISGFSGLIYESIWTHYLKLFLGHAAYAQSLVLIIFMGGMAMGSWLASRFSARSKSPLMIYAAVELIVGILALLFHDVFTTLIESFYVSILPSVGSPALGAVLKWLAASVLIMPQSILLGMTFPIMSAGILRRYPDTPGGSIAMLYFTNSIGAAVGVLASGFWLISMVGLPGTIFTAGLLNIALAVTVWTLCRLDPTPVTAPIETKVTADEDSTLKQLFLIAAFITGAASFIYEISWIRMLSLVLGATTHSFELMLSAFITGLAFGGLWIKRRIDQIKSPIRFSGYVQLIMGVLALLTIPVYVNAFDWMSWLMQALDQTDAGYTGYSVASHVIALSVMLPTTFMAGMTLPLFTYVLIRKGHGESSIGQVYAVNTVGAIAGVLLAVHVGLPILGLKGLILVGAILDIGLGIILLSKEPLQRRRTFDMAAGGLVGVGALALTIGLANIDPRLLVSGVYRHGDNGMAQEGKIIFYEDGKTASIALRAMKSGYVSLLTNGKPDASIQFGDSLPATPDEITMILLGTMPLAFNPDAKRVANIGMGAGMTTHSLLAHEGIEKVDTIEIEPAIVRAATGYGEFVERAYEDPRSEIHIEDAKTFFSLHNSVYDIIIAEPSNPWVSGVSSLFSTEFYRTAKRHLADDGVFVQWIQLYEFDDDLASSILKALSENFEDYVIYRTDSGNILLIASKQGDLPEPDWSALLETGMAKDLERIEIYSESDLLVRKILERDAILPFLNRSSVPVNSDYFPYVDLHAGRARYLDSTAQLFGSLSNAPIPVAEMLGNDTVVHSSLSSAEVMGRTISHGEAEWIYGRIANLATLEELGSRNMDLEITLMTDLVRDSMQTCAGDEDPQRWLMALHYVMKATLPYLDADHGLAIIDAVGAPDCMAQTEPNTLLWLDLYRAVARRDAASMSAGARRLLADRTDMPAMLQSYLTSVAMLGDVAAGRPEDALAAWNTYSEDAFPAGNLPAYMELIASIALESEAYAGGQLNASFP
jgi:spermidine synthase